MTKEEKLQIQRKIIKLINELCEGNEKQNACLLISVDNENEMATTHNMGDVQLLSSGLISQMDNNLNLRRFLFATFATYISSNAQANSEFLQGLELIKSGIHGVN